MTVPSEHAQPPVTATVAVVTGGNRGIGLEICRQLARERMEVVLCSRDARAGRHAAEELSRDGAMVLSHPLDVDEQESVDALAAWLERRFGRIDILINNAAILVDRVPRVLDLDAAILKSMLDTNVCGPLRVAKALVPLLRKSREARIVNVSSGLAQVSQPGSDRPAYRLSKLALNGLTRMLAADLKGEGIVVNSVSPGWVRTRMGGADAPRTTEQGADTVVWLALSQHGGATGGFYMDRKAIPW